ncbi:MAG: peptidoglycan editing factor PgeF [Parachlamydiales bacterium]|jgi:hypothetical protein
MIHKTKNGISWLEFKILQGYPLDHAYFLKHGGVSPVPYGLNFSEKNGDDLLHVERHLVLIKEIIQAKGVVRSALVHGNTVAVVQDAGVPYALEADGLITAVGDLMLMTTFADCQCTLLYDPKNHVAANVHAGWRGNVCNIYREAVTKLKDAFGTKPSDIIAGVGPSLGPNHAQFLNYRTEMPAAFLKYMRGECHFDLWEIAREQLEEEGVLPGNIEIAGICTYTEKEDFFSYRREKITGRHAGVIKLHPK